MFIQTSDHDDVTIGENYQLAVNKDQEENALSNQTISLTAFIGTPTRSAADASGVTAGSVSAKGVMTIKAAAAAE